MRASSHSPTLSQNLLDFLIGLGEFVLAQADEFLGLFQLFCHGVDIQLVIFHFSHDGLYLSHGLFIIEFLHF